MASRVFKILSNCIPVLIIAGWSSIANATLIGSTIGCALNTQARGIVIFEDSGVVVGSGPECIVIGGFDTLEIDFFEEMGMSFLSVRQSSAPIGGPISALQWDLTDLDWVDNPLGVIEGLEFLSSTYPDVAMIEASFGPHSIQVKTASFDPFDTKRGPWEATWKLNTGPTVVPIPSGIWLLGLGLVGLFGVARQRR